MSERTPEGCPYIAHEVPCERALGHCKPETCLTLGAHTGFSFSQKAPFQLDRPIEGCPLTTMELEILKQATLIDKQIGALRGRSYQTVKNVFSGVYHKLRVEGKTAALVLAIQEGWIDPKDVIIKRTTSVNYQ